MPGSKDADKKDFLADVTAFANAGGGDFVYGIREQRDERGQPTGVAEAGEGVSVLNRDALLRQLESVIRDGVEPRVAGLQTHFVDGFPSGPVFLLRIPRSWDAPHMVTFLNVSRFFSRSGASRFQLDVHQLRRAFQAGPERAERLRRFHADYDATLRVPSCAPAPPFGISPEAWARQRRVN